MLAGFRCDRSVGKKKLFSLSLSSSINGIHLFASPGGYLIFSDSSRSPENNISSETSEHNITTVLYPESTNIYSSRLVARILASNNNK